MAKSLGAQHRKTDWQSHRLHKIDLSWKATSTTSAVLDLHYAAAKAILELYNFCRDQAWNIPSWVMNDIHYITCSVSMLSM